MLTACSQSPGASRPSTPTPTRPAPTPTVELQTTCPDQDKARAAVMPPVRVGNHQNIVYLSQQDNASMLRRYDVTTGSTTTILQTSPIQQANISPDGQWILLISQYTIQLVRVDGQLLQTLYCAPAGMSLGAALLSPDQHSLVFNQMDDQNTSISILYLINLMTGQLHTLLSPLQPGYPEIAQGQAQTSPLSSFSSSHDQKTSDFEVQQLHPLAGKHFLIYTPMKWMNNSSVFLRGTMPPGAPAPPPQLYLLRDTNKDVTQQQSDLQLIANSAECQDYDVTPDNQQVVCSAWPVPGPQGSPYVIKMQPVTGGTPHVVYQSPTSGPLVARAISNTTLLFILDEVGSPSALWKVNTDGSGLTRLMAVDTQDIFLRFPYPGYQPQPIVSPDGMLYAIHVSSLSGNVESHLFGHLSGGAPKTFALQTGVTGIVVGWLRF